MKLPIIIGGLMFGMHTVMSAVAYQETRTLVLDGARQRLSTVTQQIGAMLRNQARNLSLQADSIARHPTLAAYLAGSRRDSGVALAALEPPARFATTYAGSELRDTAGAVLLRAGREAGRLTALHRADLATVGRDPQRASPGPMMRLGDSIVLPVIAPVMRDGRRIGDYVQWRFFGGSEAGRRSMSDLIGSHAAVYVGSPGGAWTDLAHPVPPPPSGTVADTTLMEYARPGSGEQIAAAVPVGDTPWQLLIEFPRDAVMQPVKEVLRRRMMIGTLILLIGLTAAWFASRYLTRELDATLGKLRDAQDELVRKERLAILGQLSSGVGHELRNPLGVMTNAVYYLDAVTGNEANPKVREYLGILRTQIGLSERIVGDLLDFARVKPPQRQSVSVPELVDTQLARLGPMPPNVEVRRLFPADTPRITVDPMQMGQVVLNLLTNAVQAMGDNGGVLSLRAGPDGPGRVQLDVIDTGPGIPSDRIQKIFEPLYTTKARGIGLGLAVSLALATNNDTELTVASTPGTGTTFSLRMPHGSGGGS